jgi:hypothetical protein
MGVSINGDPPIAGWFVSWKIQKCNRTSCCGDAGGPENNADNLGASPLLRKPLNWRFLVESIGTPQWNFYDS